MASDFLRDWWYRWTRGKLQSYVARGEEPQKAVIQSVVTALKRGRILGDDVRVILYQIEEETVRPFANQIRHRRLAELTEALHELEPFEGLSPEPGASLS